MTKSVPEVHHHRGKSSERFLNKEIILKELDIFPGQTILDAGCGNGYMSKEFAKILDHTGKIYSLDPDAHAIEALKQAVPDTIIYPLVGDITQPTAIPAASIDLLYLATVLHGFSPAELEGFKQEAGRVLKPQGVLAIIEINKAPTPFGPPLHLRFSPEELIAVMPFAPRKTVAVGEFFYMQTFENII